MALDQAFIHRMKELLIQEKEELETKLREILAPEGGMDNPDLDELAFDAEEDIYENSLETQYKQTLEKVNAALKRIEDGVYGKDIHTGEDIAQERLEVEPWADTNVLPNSEAN